MDAMFQSAIIACAAVICYQVYRIRLAFDRQADAMEHGNMLMEQMDAADDICEGDEWKHQADEDEDDLERV
mgnify:CR=1 FL=1